MVLMYFGVNNPIWLDCLFDIEYTTAIYKKYQTLVSVNKLSALLGRAIDEGVNGVY